MCICFSILGLQGKRNLTSAAFFYMLVGTAEWSKSVQAEFLSAIPNPKINSQDHIQSNQITNGHWIHKWKPVKCAESGYHILSTTILEMMNPLLRCSILFYCAALIWNSGLRSAVSSVCEIQGCFSADVHSDTMLSNAEVFVQALKRIAFSDREMTPTKTWKSQSRILHGLTAHTTVWPRKVH